MSPGDDNLSPWTAVLLVLMVMALAGTALCISGGDDDDGGNGGEEPPSPAGWGDMGELQRVLSNMEYFSYHPGDEPSDLEDAEDPETTLVLFLGLDRNMTGREVGALEDIMDEGGTVLLACDGEEGNQLAPGVEYWIEPHRIIATNFDGNHSFIPAQVELEGYPYELLFNDPRALFSHDDASETIAASIGFTSSGPVTGEQEGSAADMNDNSVIDLGDELGPISVIELFPPDKVRDGTLVVMSDSGFLNDDLIERYDNKAFIMHFLEYLMPSGGELILYTGGQEEERSPNILYIEDGGTRAGEDEVSVDNGDLSYRHRDGTKESYSDPVVEGEKVLVVLAVHSGAGRWLDASVLFNITPSGSGLPELVKTVNTTLGPGAITEVNVTWTARVGEFDVTAVVFPEAGADDGPADNTARRALTVEEGVDISVRVLLSNPNAREGDLITISATVESYAMTPVPYALEVHEVWEDDEVLAERVENETPPDGLVTELIQWKAVRGVRELRVTVEPLGPQDLDPSDNERVVDLNITSKKAEKKDEGSEVPGPGAAAVLGAGAVALICALIVRGRLR